MQEEVENRTVSFVISTSKLSVRILLAGIQKVLRSRSNRRQVRKSEWRQIRTRTKAAQREAEIRKKERGPRGKQSVRQLIRHSNGVRKLPVEADHLREFERVLKKYGVDYSFVQDVRGLKPRYLVFFKARDEEVLKDVCRECAARQLGIHKKTDKLKKPSVLAALKKFREIAARTPEKARHPEQEHSR